MRSTARWVGVALIGALSGCGPLGVGGGGGGGGGSGGTDACAGYPDVPAASDVVIRIVNQRSAAVYVDSDCGIAFDVVAGGVTHPGGMTWLQKTCFALRSEAPHTGDCASPGTPIPPGGTWETHWSALYYDTTKMPIACYSSAFNGLGDNQAPLSVCAQPTPATPGPVRLVPHVYATTTGYNVLWPSVSDPIPLEKDFVLGAVGVVEVIVE